MKALIAALLLVISPVFAEDMVLPQPTVENFLQVAALVSRYHMPAIERPVVVLKTSEWFNASRVCAGEQPCTVMGFFSPYEGKTIYLRVDMPAGIRSQILVHELVHWLQAHSGMRAADTCAEKAVLEAEAYTAAYKFSVYGEGYQGSFRVADTECP